MTKRPFSFEEFRAIYSQVPRLCVDLIIKNTDGILLTLRDIPPHKGQWHLPGGTVLFKESAEQAVRRVAADELGLKAEIDDFLGYIEFFKQDEAGGFDYPVSLVFLCRSDGQDIKTDSQASSARFFKEPPPNMVAEQAAFIREKRL
jgi:ADP-ribose pyrophosphatase YjhB (NUDIX family)